MKFEWDDARNRASIAKHGIDFADAVRIFEGIVVTDADKRFPYGEVRRVSFGRVNGGWWLQSFIPTAAAQPGSFPRAPPN